MGRKVDFSWDCDASFPDSRKHRFLSKAAGISRDAAMVAIVKLYCRARRECPDGNVSRLTDDVISDWAQNRKVTFAALIAAEWVDVFDNGATKILHGWQDRKYDELDDRRAEQARQSTERQRFRRAGGGHADVTRDKRVTTPGCHALVTRPSSEAEAEADDHPLRPPFAFDGVTISMIFREFFPTAADAERYARAFAHAVAEYGPLVQEIAAEVAAETRKHGTDPVKYLWGAISPKKPWAKEVGARQESARADAREKAEREARAGPAPADEKRGGPPTAIGELVKNMAEAKNG